MGGHHPHLGHLLAQELLDIRDVGNARHHDEALPAAVVLALIVAGVATSALWSPLRDRELFGEVGYGVPAFAEGQWWTPITGMIFGLTPWHVIVMILIP